MELFHLNIGQIILFCLGAVGNDHLSYQVLFKHEQVSFPFQGDQLNIRIFEEHRPEFSDVNIEGAGIEE